LPDEKTRTSRVYRGQQPKSNGCADSPEKVGRSRRAKAVQIPATHGGADRLTDRLYGTRPPVAPPANNKDFGRSDLLMVAVAAPAIGLLAYGLYGPESPIVVSPETTLLTEPLAADGLPDYARHALTLADRGTPPADNAAVPLLEAFWPMDLVRLPLPPSPVLERIRKAPVASP